MTRHAHTLLGLVCFLVLWAANVSAEAEQIVIKGNKFFYRTSGQRFFVRGVTYQDNARFIPGSTSFADGLADSQQCARDVPLLKKLGVNTILVSSVITAAEHAYCMRLLEEAGIYVILILNGLNEDAQVVDGARVLPWDYTTYARFFARIDAFRKFSNTLAFAIELTDMSDDASHFTPKLKAAARDMKEYIANRKYRAIPVGSLEHDHPTSSFADYMRCGAPGESVDFHGVKTIWDLPKPPADPTTRYGDPRCLNASFVGDRIVQQFKEYPIPTVLLNGCEAKYNHTFDEVPVIYGNLSDVFSGTIVEHYFDEKQTDRGLVEISGMNVTQRPSFNSLAAQFGALNTTTAKSEVFAAGANASPPPPIPCTPFSYRDGYDVAKGGEGTMSPVIPPKPNVKLCTCMMQSLSCVKNPTVPIETALSTRKKLCKQNEHWCEPHFGDTHKGVYRPYWLCNGTERVSWVLDQFYLAYNRDASACAQGGGVLQPPTPPDKMDAMCRTLLAQAGPDGMGNVTYNPYPLGADTSVPLALERAGGALESPASRAAVGIAVGAVVAFAALLAWLYVRRRRRRRIRAAEEEEEARKSVAAGQDEEESPAVEIDPGNECHEMDELEAAKKHELDDAAAAAQGEGGEGGKVHELPAQTAPEIEQLHELESPVELSSRLKARQKEIEAYGGYDKWIRVQPK